MNNQAPSRAPPRPTPIIQFMFNRLFALSLIRTSAREFLLHAHARNSYTGCNSLFSHLHISVPFFLFLYVPFLDFRFLLMILYFLNSPSPRFVRQERLPLKPIHALRMPARSIVLILISSIMYVYTLRLDTYSRITIIQIAAHASKK